MNTVQIISSPSDSLQKSGILSKVRTAHFRKEFLRTLSDLHERVTFTLNAIASCETGTGGGYSDTDYDNLHVILGSLSTQIVAIEMALACEDIDRECDQIYADAQSTIAAFDSALISVTN